MDAMYILVQDLLRGDTLTVFNKEQAMFEEQTADNLKHCLNAVIVHIFPNKMYKLQKQCIQHTTHKPRHVSVHEWIARVIKLNSYLMEFPTPARVKARKMDQKEILEVLENGIPT
eukprot:15364841-Ditylum_brightwellii.AAC.1